MESKKDLGELAIELSYFKLVIPQEKYSYEKLLEALTLKISDLINTNFSALVQLLYQLDISENKLKELLKQFPDKQAELIGKAIIERQLQKIESRKLFSKNDYIPEDERW